VKTRNDENECFDINDWNDYAHCYDALSELIPYQNLQRDVVRLLRPQTGDVILDAGCGTGNLIQELRKSYSPRSISVTAIDFSSDMLAYARKKKNSGGVRFALADLNAPLPFRDETFDKIACVNTLYALSNPRNTLAELKRILKTGGVIVVATPKLGFENGLILKEHSRSEKPDEYWLNAHAHPERERALIREAFGDTPLAKKMTAVAKHNRAIGAHASFHFYTIDGLTEVFQSAGLRPTRAGMTYANQALILTAEKQKGGPA